MGYFEWSEEISINVVEIDEQHKLLIGIINDLHDSIQEGSAKEDINKILVRLILYIQIHFDTEEHLMTETNYPDETEQKKEHFALATRVGELYRRQLEGQPSVAIEIMDFLKIWLTDHILNIDKKFGTYLSNTGRLA